MSASAVTTSMPVRPANQLERPARAARPEPGEERPRGLVRGIGLGQDEPDADVLQRPERRRDESSAQPATAVLGADADEPQLRPARGDRDADESGVNAAGLLDRDEERRRMEQR